MAAPSRDGLEREAIERRMRAQARTVAERGFAIRSEISRRSSGRQSPSDDRVEYGGAEHRRRVSYAYRSGRVVDRKRRRAETNHRRDDCAWRSWREYGGDRGGRLVEPASLRSSDAV